VALSTIYLGLLVFKGGANLLRDWSIALGMPGLATLVYVLFGVAGALALLELILDVMDPKRF